MGWSEPGKGAEWPLVVGSQVLPRARWRLLETLPGLSWIPRMPLMAAGRKERPGLQVSERGHTGVTSEVSRAMWEPLGVGSWVAEQRVMSPGTRTFTYYMYVNPYPLSHAHAHKYPHSTLK